MENDRVLMALKPAIEIEHSGPEGVDFAKLFKDAEERISEDCCVVCRLAGAPQVAAGLEEHHVAGKMNFPDSITVCRQCHEDLSDHQKDWLVCGRSHSEKLSCYLYGWADIFDLLNQKSGRPCFLSLARKFRSQGWHIRNNARER